MGSPRAVRDWDQHARGEQREAALASISFFSHTPEDEKPYHLMYGDLSGLPKTNLVRQWRDTVIKDIRGSEDTLDYDKTGIAIRRLDSRMSYDDFADDARITGVYYRELEKFLERLLGAKAVIVFRHCIRKRHPSFPVSIGEKYDFEQPTSIAHVDATALSTIEELSKHEKRLADAVVGSTIKRVQWVNVWKPLRGPVNDWPLAFCDASTVETKDLAVTDMVYPTYYTENLSVAYNDDRRWYYLSDHQPDELIIFKQSDTEPESLPGVPHTSFSNPSADPAESPRESIEARALVIYT